MVVESVFEDLQLKKELFNQMGEILKQRSVPTDQMLLCSNTMNLSLAEFTEDVCKECVLSPCPPSRSACARAVRLSLSGSTQGVPP